MLSPKGMDVPFGITLQEPISTVLHVGGALFFLALTPALLRRSRLNGARLASVTVYALAVQFLLWMSSLYHSLAPGPARDVAQRLDHVGIFLLIAGTFTPVKVILFRGVLRSSMLGFVWLFALCALTVKTVFFSDVPEWLGLLLYVSLGWVGVISGAVLWRRHGLRFVGKVLGGGVAYTVGAVMEFLRWPVLWDGAVGPHEMFHAAVLVGIGLHWSFIYDIAAAEGLHERRRPEHGAR